MSCSLSTLRSSTSTCSPRPSPLSLPTLVSRYEESTPQFIGHPANLKLSFLALVARLFGEEEAKRVDREIR